MINISRKSYKIKIKIVIIFMFILSVLVQAFTAEYESIGFVSQLKYIICCLTILVCLFSMYKTNTTNIFKYEFKNVVWIIFVFAIISLIRSLFAYSFTTRTLQELLFLLIPVLFAYGILNTLSHKIIDKCMLFTLIALLIGYFLEIDMGISDFIREFTTMSFSDSYSPFESSTFAGVSIAIAMYFLYFRRNKLGFILSILFVVLTFKRLALLFTIFLIFIPKIFNYNNTVSRSILNVIKIGTFLLTLGYFLMMIPENVDKIYNLFNIDLYKLTMSRTYRFQLIYNKSNFINTGLGSTFNYMMNRYGVTLEMDFIKLLIEVTPMGVFIFINNMCNIVKKNWYCMFLMLFQFLNLITSHSLASMYSWIIFYITIGCILYGDKTNGIENY